MHAGNGQDGGNVGVSEERNGRQYVLVVPRESGAAVECRKEREMDVLLSISAHSLRGAAR